jgi:hypothetical protein
LILLQYFLYFTLYFNFVSLALLVDCYLVLFSLGRYTVFRPFLARYGNFYVYPLASFLPFLSFSLNGHWVFLVNSFLLSPSLYAFL